METAGVRATVGGDAQGHRTIETSGAPPPAAGGAPPSAARQSTKSLCILSSCRRGDGRGWSVEKIKNIHWKGWVHGKRENPCFPD